MGIRNGGVLTSGNSFSIENHYSFRELYEELKTELPTSDSHKRQAWAKSIIENKIDLIELSALLDEERKVATRFAWLLTGIGIQDPPFLLSSLPYLLRKSKKINHFKFSESFANYWLIVGVPKENEAETINLLFQWISSDQVNVTIKSRAINVLMKLKERHPDLKNELSVCLHEQMGRHTDTFKNKVIKVLKQLDQ